MKLTEQDKQILRDFGHPESDMRQLCEAARRCKHTDEHGNRISAEKAINLLGRKTWLSGISRAAFHATAGRGEYGKNYVSFDCKKMLFG